MFMSKFDDISVDEWSVQIIRHLTKHFMRPIFWFEHNGIEKFEFENLKDKELAVAKLALEATSFPPLSLTCSFDHYTIYRSGYEDCYIFARKLYILWKETFNKSDPMDLYNEVISHIADRFTKANLKGEIPNAVQED